MLEIKNKSFSSYKKYDQRKRSCLTSKGLAKLLPRIQNLYQITYIFCNTLPSVSIKPFDIKWLAPRGTLGLQCIYRAQLLIHTTHLPCSLPCNYVTSLLAYCRGQIRINWYRYCIKLLLSIFNSSLKKLSNLESSFLIIDTSWKNKTLIISAQTFRMVINLSKKFLETQKFFIAWNKKQMIFLLGKTGSRERKLLNLKTSSKTFTQNTKAISNYIYVL